MRRHRLYENDHFFDTGSANRLSALVRELPRVVTRGATIVVDGKPRFKSARTISCPRCARKLRRGTTTLIFKHAAIDRSRQTVEAWVCDCGEAYVPGDIARDAHRRALWRPATRGLKDGANLARQPRPQQIAALNEPVTDLNLSVRARECMSRLGISTLGELVRRSADQLLEVKNFGVTSLKEVRQKLARRGLKLCDGDGTRRARTTETKRRGVTVSRRQKR